MFYYIYRLYVLFICHLILSSIVFRRDGCDDAVLVVDVDVVGLDELERERQRAFDVRRGLGLTSGGVQRGTSAELGGDDIFAAPAPMSANHLPRSASAALAREKLSKKKRIITITA